MGYHSRTCPECGDNRTIVANDRRQIEKIRLGVQLCRDCNGLRWASHLPPVPARRAHVDEIAVDRLVAGSPVRATVAERIEAMRRLPGLSASEIAERFGVTSRTVQRYRSELRRMVA